MIRINLLPVRASRRQEAVKTELMLAGLVLAAVVVVLGGLHIVLMAQSSSLTAENIELDAELKKKEAIRLEVEEMEKVRKDLEQKLAVIQQLNANRIGPVLLLSDLSDATPEKLQITSLIEKQGQITFTGVAVTHEVISQFMINIEKSKRFTDVGLNGVEQVEDGGVKLKEFEITAKLVTEASKVEAEAAAKAKAKAGGGAAPAGAPPADGAAPAPPAAPADGTAPAAPPPAAPAPAGGQE
ncbi:MAG: PilN domain-containing protein [Deltaproteobacteria bacterium]|nr:PilN domain-containing protein [Deltaproteobacteria bacterium]